MIDPPELDARFPLRTGVALVGRIAESRRRNRMEFPRMFTVLDPFEVSLLRIAAMELARAGRSFIEQKTIVLTVI